MLAGYFAQGHGQTALDHEPDRGRVGRRDDGPDGARRGTEPEELLELEPGPRQVVVETLCLPPSPGRAHLPDDGAAGRQAGDQAGQSRVVRRIRAGLLAEPEEVDRLASVGRRSGQVDELAMAREQGEGCRARSPDVADPPEVERREEVREDSCPPPGRRDWCPEPPRSHRSLRGRSRKSPASGNRPPDQPRAAAFAGRRAPPVPRTTARRGLGRSSDIMAVRWRPTG